MVSQPQNPEFMINPENFHPCWNNSVKCSLILNQFTLYYRGVWWLSSTQGRRVTSLGFNEGTASCPRA